MKISNIGDGFRYDPLSNLRPARVDPDSWANMQFSRLLRCPARGREDISSIGVPVSRVQGAIGAQPQSLEGLEETRSNKEQVAPPKIGSLEQQCR